MNSETTEHAPPDRDVQTLRLAGLRVTSSRLATMAVLRGAPHADVETIADAVRARLGSVSRQTIYDVLRALIQAQILRRVSPEGFAARYELDKHDNHHHLLCERCGALVDVPCAVDYVPCVLPPVSEHLRVDRAEIIYHGTCEACRRAQSLTSGSAASAAAASASTA